MAPGLAEVGIAPDRGDVIGVPGRAGEAPAAEPGREGAADGAAPGRAEPGTAEPVIAAPGFAGAPPEGRGGLLNVFGSLMLLP